MAGSLQFPDVSILVSSSDPNDPAVVDVWKDLTTRTWRVNSASRGRQYELDQNLTGAASLDWRNVDEALNPANSSSPLAALAKPMRRIRWMASYPPNGTGNTINTVAGMDPTFDSYATGSLPAWLTAVGSTSPTVQAANPHSGANSLQYTVAASATQQGVTTTSLPFIPGKQYTASAWVRQSSASTQQIAVGGLTTMDTFNRTVSSGWGSADTGEAWSTISAGTPINASDFNVNNGTATMSQPVLNGYRVAYLPSFNQADVDLAVTASIPVMPTGGPLELGNLCARGTSTTSYYLFRAQVEVSGAVTAVIFNPSGTQLTSQTVAGLTYSPNMQLRVRAQAIGNLLQLKVWAAGVPEPSAWTISITDTAYTGAGWVGIRSGISNTNSNVKPVVFTYSAFRMFYVAAGSTTPTTGAYVRLTATFTATQPTHTVQVTTIGTAVAGTVNVDDVQAEPGGTASAFTTTGPLIRGVWGGHVGAYPVTWIPGSAGFEGSVSAPCVGPFAALAQIGIHTDYVTAILAKAPAYYWPLWDGTGTTRWAEISGNNGPALARWTAPSGPGTDVAAGTPDNVPGDPSGTGTLFTQTANTSPVTATLIGAGPAFRSAGITFPTTNVPSTWGVSWAAWVKMTYPIIDASQFIMKMATFLPNNGTQVGIGSFVAVNDGSIDATVTGNGQGFLSVGGLGATHKLDDGKVHLLVGTLSQANPGNTVLTVYLDGQQYATTTVATSASLVVSTPAQNVMVGGRNDGTVTNQVLNGMVAHAAVWDRVLSTQEITDLWNAGQGYVGETSGTRAGRYLGNYYTGPTVVDTGTSSAMGPPSAVEATPLLQALQRIQDTEAGNLFENRDGGVQFDGREIRYLRTAPAATFGDGAGEIPYTEAPVWGFDVTQTNNQALVTRTGGIRAVSQPDTTGSIRSFYPRGYTLTVDCQTDLEAIDHANWVVANRAQPKQRVQTITIDLGSNPAQFTTILNLEIGQRYTVKRRAKSANAGAGITMSADYYLERIAHRQVDPQTASWLVDLQLSPVPLQPWILGDSTYGVLGTTTVLGF